MANCPGSASIVSPVDGSSSSVHVSAVSRPRLRTTYGWGTIGPGEATRGSTAMAASVEIGEPQARRVQALEEHGGEALHQLVAERRVVLALAPDAGSVDDDRAHRRHSSRVEVPHVGREQPRPADDRAG